MHIYEEMEEKADARKEEQNKKRLMWLNFFSEEELEEEINRRTKEKLFNPYSTEELVSRLEKLKNMFSEGRGL